MTDLIERVKAALENATPGPWFVTRPDYHQGMVQINGPSVTARGFTIAIDVDAKKARKIECDASLIALAPDMARALVAAQGIVEAIRAQGPRTISPLVAYKISVFRAALEDKE